MPETDLAALAGLIPFASMLGIELLEAGPELVRARLASTPERWTVGGIMHGGAIMALADNGGGICAFVNIRDDGKLAAKVTQTQAYQYPRGG
jgi:1,4-dihydroxy-2-naphthoyl-CoA hydrolase